MCKCCANDVDSIFESPDVENLSIMKIILNNENSRGSFKSMRAVDSKLKSQFRWPKLLKPRVPLPYQGILITKNLEHGYNIIKLNPHEIV